jgi:hypothetical protein
MWSNRDVAGGTDEHVVVFVFGEIFSYGGFVRKVEKGRQFARESHLFVETSSGGRDGRFAGMWVAAAGVGPESSGVVLARGSPLKQKPSCLVKDEHRQGPVKPALGVGLHLLSRAEWLIVVINKYDPSAHDRKGETERKPPIFPQDPSIWRFLAEIGSPHGAYYGFIAKGAYDANSN